MRKEKFRFLVSPASSQLASWEGQELFSTYFRHCFAESADCPAMSIQEHSILQKSVVPNLLEKDFFSTGDEEEERYHLEHVNSQDETKAVDNVSVNDTVNSKRDQNNENEQLKEYKRKMFKVGIDFGKTLGIFKPSAQTEFEVLANMGKWDKTLELLMLSSQPRKGIFEVCKSLELCCGSLICDGTNFP